MLNKKYITRTDLKVAGFSNLEFTVNRPESKVHLTADYTNEIGKVKYKIQFEVEKEIKKRERKKKSLDHFLCWIFQWSDQKWRRQREREM